MKKIPSIVLAILFFSLLTAALPAPTPPLSEEIEIQVSPHTILLTWNTKGGVRVTVHADIDYSLVDTYSVVLGGCEATSTFDDNRGNLVAKFNYEDVAELVGAGGTPLVLTGFLTDGTAFSGEDEVRVVQ